MKPRRILIDCTETHATRMTTGIQRVVRELALYAARHPVFEGCELVPIAMRRGVPRRVAISSAPPGWRERLIARVRAGAVRVIGVEGWRFAAARAALRGARAAADRLRRMSGGGRTAPPTAAEPGGEGDDDGAIRIEATDVVLAADVGWGRRAGEFRALLDEAARRGAPVIGVVYDLIPVLFPDLIEAAAVAEFREFLAALLPRCAGLVAISRSTQASVAAYLRREHPRLADLPLGWFHLGADLTPSEAASPGLRPALRHVLRGGPVYLAVGSVEPRKNYVAILDAFEELWRGGAAVQLCIAGRRGRRSERERERLARSPYRGTRLHWFHDVSDAELLELYRGARALVQASLCEGFGLPVVEAMAQGLPVIASDIEVLREVAGDYASYFAPQRPEALAAAVKRLEARLASGWKPAARRWQTWEQSAAQLLAAALDVHRRAAGRGAAARR